MDVRIMYILDVYYCVLQKLVGIGFAVYFAVVLVTFGYAAETKLKVSVESGSLSLTSPDEASLSGVSLESETKVVQGLLGAIKIIDNRGSGVGWSVTASVSDFSCCDGKYTIPVSYLTIKPGKFTTGGNSEGVKSGATKIVGDSSEVITLMSANNGSGMGAYEINPTIELKIPSDALAGNYAAVISITVI